MTNKLLPLQNNFYTLFLQALSFFITKNITSLFDKGNNQGKLKALLHNKAITNLLAKMAPIKPEGVLIDQFTQPDTYYKYLAKQKQVQRENVYFATKGESVHLAVAAASILARYSFVKQFNELSKSWYAPSKRCR